MKGDEKYILFFTRWKKSYILTDHSTELPPSQNNKQIR